MKKEGASSLISSSTTVTDDESDQGSIINGATETETEAAAESLAFEGDLGAVNSIIVEAIQKDIETSNVETNSLVEVADESVTKSGIDQIVAEDEQQSQTDNGKEEFIPSTETVEPGPVITESSRRRRFFFCNNISFAMLKLFQRTMRLILVWLDKVMICLLWEA